MHKFPQKQSSLVVEKVQDLQHYNAHRVNCFFFFLTRLDLLQPTILSK